MKYPILNKRERKFTGIIVLLGLLDILVALMYYGYKDWMVLGFLGIGLMVYSTFAEVELFGV